MMKAERSIKFGIFLLALAFLVSSIQFSSALNATVCCEKTNSGLYCQNVPANECRSDSTQAPTACESTSFCKPGVCYNSGQGTCLDKTPQLVCNINNGTWSVASPIQCELGCCVLGDQAAFVTLTRCKYLSSQLGLQTNYNKGIKDEVQCVLSVQSQEKGACVYDFEFQKTCKFTTRSECLGQGGTNRTQQKDFFEGKLCSAPELGTICGKTKDTLCVPGKDEVYFVDSCGNPANIYDASKAEDEEYWTNLKDKSESCNPNSANYNSKACGNCNYLQGSYCRAATKQNLPNYGDNVCADLNCKTTSNGKSYRHGESWCVYDDAGKKDQSDNAVGSRFYKHICINGQETLEQCADFRQEECIEDALPTTVGDFSQAACRVNRWQDCLAQTDQKDCENIDRRDCSWKTGVKLGNNTDEGVCLPKNSPGLKFWQGDETKAICAQANSACVVTFEKGLFGGEKCKENCECLTDEWTKDRSGICTALGDCGPKINWEGQEGYKPGFNVSRKKV